jgi:hypothetical protein
MDEVNDFPGESSDDCRDTQVRQRRKQRSARPLDGDPGILELLGCLVIGPVAPDRFALSITCTSTPAFFRSMTPAIKLGS